MRRLRSLLWWLARFAPALLLVAWVCEPAPAVAQTSSMFSNLANPAIGMNALFSAQAAPNLAGAYGLNFDEAELSLLSVVDPYWMLAANIVFVGDGTVDPEEVWARSTNIPSIQLKLGKLRGTFGKHGLLHYGQLHIISRGLGNSASTPEISPAFLHINVNGIQEAAGSLRPNFDQEGQCS